MAEPTRGRPDMPAGYGVPAGPGEAQLSWDWARTELAAARNYWICTTHPDGRPHAMPVWGLWLDDALFFSTDPRSRKGKNIARDPRITVHLESGDDVVVLEGTVVIERDTGTLRRFAEEYDRKYDIKVDTDNPDYGIYALHPRQAWTFREQAFPDSATKWTFAPPD